MAAQRTLVVSCVLLTVLVACSGTAPSEQDAGAASAVQAVESPFPDLERHGLALPDLDADGARSVPGFTQGDASFRPIVRDTGLSAARAEVLLPRTADGVVSLAFRGARARIRLLGAAKVAGIASASGVHYPAALDGADLVHVARPTGTEEYVHLLAPRSSRTLRYALTMEGVAGLRLVGGVLELLDAEGTPLLRTTAPTAVDGRGRARVGSLGVVGCAYDDAVAAPHLRPVVAPGRDTCEVVATFDDEGLTYPLWVDPAWTTTAVLARPRIEHRLTLNTDAAAGCATGCALVTGGTYKVASTVFLAPNAEWFNPVTNVWINAGAPSCGARSLHAAVDVANRGVLVAGGYVDTAYTTTATACTWTTAGWAAATSMSVARAEPAASAMRVGTTNAAFVAGGFLSDGSSVATVERWVSGTWSTMTSLPVARGGGALAAVGSSCTGTCTGVKLNFCVFGGRSSDGGAAMRNVDCGAVAGTAVSYTSLPTGLSVARNNATIAQIFQDGVVHVFGGGGPGLDQVDLFAASFAVSPIVGMGPTSALQGTAGARIATASGNRTLVIGGGAGYAANATSLIVDTVGPRQSSSPLSFARREGQAVPLPDGRVLVAGGRVDALGGYPAAEEVFAQASNGVACAGFGDCKSGFCADGVCCDAACTGKCEYCKVPSFVGTCKPQPAGATPAAGHGTCLNSPVGGECGYQCNGTTTAECTAPASTKTCLTPKCDATGFTSQPKCDGAGTCFSPSPVTCGAYTCNAAGTACKTSCTTFADCATGNTCTGGACVPTGGKGGACTLDVDCSSGFKCVDNVCCASPSCAAPLKCNVPGVVGECRLPLGTACTSVTASLCGTGNCVDGVCCDGPCSNQCEACNVSGRLGLCSPIPSGGKPVGGRTACTGSGACQASCDGTTRVTCGAPPPKTTVCAAATCTAGVAADTSYCDGTGVCVAGAKTPCVGVVCGATACLPSCTGPSDCAAGYFCDTTSGTCRSTGAAGTACATKAECKSGNCIDGVCCTTASCPSGQVCNASGTGVCALPLGASCTAGTACGSGQCVDGVCCDKACTGQCEACDLGGKVGTCSPVSGDPHGARTACKGTGPCQAKCDGTNAVGCATPPGTSTPCAPALCSGTSRTDISYCDGLGACKTPSATSCIPFTCDASTCKASCATKADCASGYACKEGKCVTEGGLGTLCSDPSECKSGKCVASTKPGDSVCCAVDSCPTGSACGLGGTDAAGLCVKKQGQTCTSATECATGFCVDGVCCESVCTGQCEACDVGGAEGKCVGVTGAPHGTRTACSSGGADVCKALTCDGSKDRNKCASFANGLEKECARACESGTLSVASCDGSGGCGAPKTSSCAGYACDGDRCRTACTSKEHCTAGYYCGASGKCEPAVGKCSDDRKSSTDPKTGATSDCAPYLCDPGSGACIKTCGSANDCQPGAACSEGRCEPAAPVDDSGGCAMRHPTGPGAGVALALAALVVARRRRSKR